MALILDTEVILTEILKRDSNDEGVDYRTICRYCDRVTREVFANTNRTAVSYSFDANSLERCVIDYPEQFSKCCGRYYRGVFYNPKLFERRNSKRINKILDSVAQNM